MSTSTVTPPARPAGKPAAPHWFLRRILWPLRNLWRSLTSMRTALVLLFCWPWPRSPALLPQRELNEQKTLQYIDSHGTVGEWMDRLQLFDVFSSVWFTAIYVLLFVSLVGCLTPRMIEHAKSLRAKPVAALRNLGRLPRHETFTVDGAPDEIAERITGRLGGWRRSPPNARSPTARGSSRCRRRRATCANSATSCSTSRCSASSSRSHWARCTATRAPAVSSPTASRGCATPRPRCTTRSGPEASSTAPICRRSASRSMTSATFLPNGQPSMYNAEVSYTDSVGAGVPTDWKHTSIKVNEPLRLAGDRVYVLGNGYAPTFTVTFPNGQKRTQTVLFIPEEMATMLSSGAARFDTPAGMYPDEDERRNNQIALQGIFAPTAEFTGSGGKLLQSASPIPKKPAVAIDVYKGDTGLDTGRPQNVYQLDSDLMHQAGSSARPASTWNRAVAHPRRRYDRHLRRLQTLGVGAGLARPRAEVGTRVRRLDAGGSARLAAGAAQAVVGQAGGDGRGRGCARRRQPGKRRTVVEIAGLARTDQAGWGEGFSDQAAALVGNDAGRRVRGL